MLRACFLFVLLSFSTKLMAQDDGDVVLASIIEYGDRLKSIQLFDSKDYSIDVTSRVYGVLNARVSCRSGSVFANVVYRAREKDGTLSLVPQRHQLLFLEDCCLKHDVDYCCAFAHPFPFRESQLLEIFWEVAPWQWISPVPGHAFHDLFADSKISRYALERVQSESDSKLSLLFNRRADRIQLDSVPDTLEAKVDSRSFLPIEVRGRVARGGRILEVWKYEWESSGKLSFLRQLTVESNGNMELKKVLSKLDSGIDPSRVAYSKDDFRRMLPSGTRFVQLRGDGSIETEEFLGNPESAKDDYERRRLAERFRFDRLYSEAKKKPAEK
jgi:hypothetical protein